MHTRVRPVSAIALTMALSVAALVADDGTAHRRSSDLFGVSGGNVNDSTKRFCCSGTLGALVTDGSSLYILSNNHVLARSGQGGAGEDISQPGLIDTNCQVAERVADLSYAAPLGSSNVDAALAELRPGAMDPSGEIMDIGVPSSSIAAPAVGLSVTKSGRTTGQTMGSVSAINTSVQVQYQANCGSGKKFRVTYTNQVVISSSTFSAGGDSGSLIVTNDVSHRPVALLFAGSSTTTIANPIGEVLLRLGAAAGKSFSFNVAGAGGGQASVQSSLPPDEITRGNRAKDAHEGRLMGDPDVLGVGVGEDELNPGRAAVVVFVRRGGQAAAIARRLDGVPTRVIETDEIVAYGWNQPEGGSCAKKQ